MNLLLCVCLNVRAVHQHPYSVTGSILLGFPPPLEQVDLVALNFFEVESVM